MRIVCADTNRARQTAEQIHRGLLDGLDQYGRDAEIGAPETIDELKNFQVWTPDGIRDITASFRKYQAEMEKMERMAVGDRPRWLVEIDRFYRTQLGGADPIQQWLTIPLMYFESPQSCVRRFWKGFNRLIAESPGQRIIAATHSGPDPRVRDLGARLRPGRAGQHRGGRGPDQEGRPDGDGELPQPGHRGERAAGRRDPEVGRVSVGTARRIIGPGNIGTDLLAKLQRSDVDRGPVRRRRGRVRRAPAGPLDGHRGVGRGAGLAARPATSCRRSSSTRPRPRRTARRRPGSRRRASSPST